MSAIGILPVPPDNFSTTLSGSISDTDLTVPLNSVANLPTEGVGVKFTKDANGDVEPASIEFIHWTGVSGNNLTLSDIGDRGLTGSASGAQASSAGAFFEVWVSSYYYQSLLDNSDIHAATEKTTPADADELGLIDSAASYVLKRLTVLGLKLAIYAGIKPAEGTMWNGKISVTDAAGITVALKTLAGTDPSASDPVYITLGGAVRTITAALSVAKADGTNWCNAGSAELATKEIDYFVYLGYNATDGVVIGFSRYPGANSYDDFSATTTNEKYCAISTITNAAATDYYEVIGRFAATLSAGAGYTWSVPTYTAKNLIQRPIYETRELTSTGVVGVISGTGTCYYKVVGSTVFLNGKIAITAAGAGSSVTLSAPFTSKNNTSIDAYRGAGRYNDAGVMYYTPITELPINSKYIFWLMNNEANYILGNRAGLGNTDSLNAHVVYEI